MASTAFVSPFLGASTCSPSSFAGSKTSRRPSPRSGAIAPKAVLGSQTTSSTFGAPSTKQTYVVKVMQKDRCTQVEVERDANLRKSLIDAKVDIYTLGGKLRNCGGAGQCGTCIVNVENGVFGLSPPTAKEDILLEGKPESWRLACRAKVCGDVTVRTKPKM